MLGYSQKSAVLFLGSVGLVAKHPPHPDYDGNRHTYVNLDRAISSFSFMTVVGGKTNVELNAPLNWDKNNGACTIFASVMYGATFQGCTNSGETKRNRNVCNKTKERGGELGRWGETTKRLRRKSPESGEGVQDIRSRKMGSDMCCLPVGRLVIVVLPHTASPGKERCGMRRRNCSSRSGA